MFGAYYFAQYVFAAPAVIAEPCGGMVFGAVYFGQMPSCSDVPGPPGPSPTPTTSAIAGGRPPIATYIRNRNVDDRILEEEIFQAIAHWVTLN